MLDVDAIGPVWNFAVGAMPAAEFEKWACENEELERMVGSERYLKIISAHFRDAAAVHTLRSELSVWLDAHIEGEVNEGQRKAHWQIQWAARQILRDELGLVEGARIISSNYWILYPDQEHWGLFSVFIALDSETDHLPTDTDRERWDEEAWHEKQVEVQHVENLYRARLLSASRKLLALETASGDV